MDMAMMNNNMPQYRRPKWSCSLEPIPEYSELIVHDHSSTMVNMKILKQKQEKMLQGQMHEQLKRCKRISLNYAEKLEKEMFPPELHPHFERAKQGTQNLIQKLFHLQSHHTSQHCKRWSDIDFGVRTSLEEYAKQLQWGSRYSSL